MRKTFIHGSNGSIVPTRVNTYPNPYHTVTSGFSRSRLTRFEEGVLPTVLHSFEGSRVQSIMVSGLDLVLHSLEGLACSGTAPGSRCVRGIVVVLRVL